MSLKWYIHDKLPFCLEHLYLLCSHILFHRQTSTYLHIEIPKQDNSPFGRMIFFPNMPVNDHLFHFSFDILETRVAFQCVVEFSASLVHSCEWLLAKLRAILPIVSGFYSIFFELLQRILFPQYVLALKVLNLQMIINPHVSIPHRGTILTKKTKFFSN